ncbi:MAG: VOC family protein [Clostridiales bacterium]|nr:VOC family protein [Clostridiales bacterium]MCI6935078.1 VOC family protein [Clostridiales bacterium]
MKIDHIALYVNDLAGAKAFFETYFQAVSNGGYHNKTTDFRSYFLAFSDGSRLEIMTKPDLTDSGNLLDRFGYAHIAFSVGSHEAVDELTARLNAGGYPTLSGPKVTGDGYYESCVLGFEGNILEITV